MKKSERYCSDWRLGLASLCGVAFELWTTVNFSMRFYRLCLKLLWGCVIGKWWRRWLYRQEVNRPLVTCFQYPYAGGKFKYSGLKFQQALLPAVELVCLLNSNYAILQCRPEPTMLIPQKSVKRQVSCASYICKRFKEVLKHFVISSVHTCNKCDTCLFVARRPLTLFKKKT